MATALLGAMLAVSIAAGASAAEGRLRIAKQFGVVYLLLDVAAEKKLIETHGKAADVDVAVEFVQFSGGSAVNGALLSGSIEVAGAGVGPFFTI